MAKKKTAKKTHKKHVTPKRKKNWLSIFFVLAIATVIGLPLSLSLTKSNNSSISSEGSTVPVNPWGKNRIPTSTCKVGIASIVMLGSCGSNKYKQLQYTCQDGYSETLGDQISCKDKLAWAKDIASICVNRSSCSITRFPTRQPIIPFFTKHPLPTTTQ